MSGRDYLFYGGDLRATVDNHKKKLILQIGSLSPAQLLPNDDKQVCDHFVGEFTIAPIELQEERIELIEPREVKVEARDYDFGNRYQKTVLEFRFEIPFTGDADLFQLQPSTFNMNFPRGYVEKNHLIYINQRGDRNTAAIKSEVDSFLNNVRQHLGWQRPELETWNSGLPQLVGQLVSSRRQKLDADKQLVNDLGFQVRRRGETSPSYSFPLQRKTVTPPLPAAKGGPLAKQEPAIEMAVYEEILDTLASMSIVMERSPSAFANLDEEALRMQFLIPLNSNFKGSASGETFNMSGKTDILIKHEDRILFVAECKFWRGPQSLTETIDQLLGYLTWRDSKAAIILFNRNKDFSSVLSQIQNVFQAHPQFVRQDPYAKTTGFRFVIKHPSDNKKPLLVTLLAFDVPQI